MGFILDPLYNLVSGVIIFFHKILTPIFGTDSGVTWSLSIVGLVILIRIILIPLFVKQIKSQRALTALQPQMKAIQTKYKDDRQKQSEEMMKLYKEHKTNPLARPKNKVRIAVIKRGSWLLSSVRRFLRAS